MSQNKYVPQGIQTVLQQLTEPYLEMLPSPSEGSPNVDEKLKTAMEEKYQVVFATQSESSGISSKDFWTASAQMPDGRTVTAEAGRVSNMWETGLSTRSRR